MLLQNGNTGATPGSWTEAESIECQVPSKNTFWELRLVAAYSISLRKIIVFLSISYFLSFCHVWGKLSPTRSWIIHIFVLPQVLLSTEPPDPTGPSLFHGPYSWTGRRVSCLGEPELSGAYETNAVALATPFKLLIKWNEICTIISQLRAAHEVLVRETKPNSKYWNSPLCI